MRKASWIWIVAALAVASFGCKKEEPVAESTPAAQPAAAQPPAAAPAETTPAPAQPAPAASETPAVVPKSGFDRALLRPAMLGEIAPDSYQVKFSTTRGDFTVTVTRSWAPVGADRFYNLVKHHFYDNSSFFRVVPGFVVQFGLSAYPPVSAAWQHANLKDDPVTQSNKKGTLTFATAGPNTRTTQIFINLKDNAGLDGQGFSPFGAVDGKGMNVVEMFYDQYGDNTPRDYQDLITREGKPYLDKNWPKLDSIKSVTLVAAPK
ncbi:MAG TPA: peptidylprolyl isomerase [Candidatus Angelobacter sp.]|nr:peptidylprolyl isomerase [Candidatus Angelobacter sp.]